MYPSINLVSTKTIIGTILAVLLPIACFSFKYWKSIRTELSALREQLAVQVVRDTTTPKTNECRRRRVICMELDPDFVKRFPDVPMMSLGQYLTQLRVKCDDPITSSIHSASNSSISNNSVSTAATLAKTIQRTFLEKELKATLAKALLTTLGAKFGSALLPLLLKGGGKLSVTGRMESIAAAMSEFIARSIVDDSDAIEDNNEGEDEIIMAVDPMAFNVDLKEMTSLVNMNQKRKNYKTKFSDRNDAAISNNDNNISKDNDGLSPLEYLKRGESGKGDLAYDLGGDNSFPSSFDMELNFQQHITLMEERIRQSGDTTYDPLDISLPPPTPIHPRILPGLCLGTGSLQCTHTRREGIEHRLLCVLMNKLSYNYHRMQCRESPCDLFRVICAGKTCLFPEELIQALVDCGHTVEVCPRVIPTNFGLSLCVKENDGRYTYIPTVVMMSTGVESIQDGNVAFFAAPHGGMDVTIRGPLIGRGERPAWIQFYVSIDGLTCFHPDQDVDAPWSQKVSLTDIYSHNDAIRAVRLCAFVAVTFNRIATELALPFGGYGVLGMCNDSATFVDLAVRGETNSYPLISTGRFLIYIAGAFARMKEEIGLVRNSGMYDEKLVDSIVEDIEQLIQATCSMPSDLHVSPKTLIDMCRRYEASYPRPIFQKTADAKKILKEVSDISQLTSSIHNFQGRQKVG